MFGELASGTVVLVGGGPGDPDLITVAGLRAVQQADVIVHDRLAPLDCLTHAKRDAEIIPVGKIPRGPQTSQDRINTILVDRARQGLRVVRLKGGDGYVFGRGGEEVLACAAAGVPVRVIPGVTSAVAVPALAGIPVTHRALSQGFCVVSGHVAPDDPRSAVNWEALAASGTTIVVLMGVGFLQPICERLTAAGLHPDTPAAVVADGCSPGRVVLRCSVATLPGQVRDRQVGPPAIVVVGPTAALDLTGEGFRSAGEDHVFNRMVDNRTSST